MKPARRSKRRKKKGGPHRASPAKSASLQEPRSIAAAREEVSLHLLELLPFAGEQARKGKPALLRVIARYFRLPPTAPGQAPAIIFDIPGRPQEQPAAPPHPGNCPCPSCQALRAQS